MNLFYVFYLAVLGLAIVSAAQVKAVEASVYVSSVSSNPQYHIKFGVLDKYNAAAFGYYYPEQNVTGFDRLYVHSNSHFPDDVQAYAIGFLEGAITAPQLYLTSRNFLNNDFSGKHTPGKILDFMHTQLRWIQDEIKANPESLYWKNIELVLKQFFGLVRGYNTQCEDYQALDFDTLFAIASAGELADLVPGLIPSQRCEWYRFPQEVCLEEAVKHHCTAFIRLLPDYSDIFAAHNLWTSYGNLRIYKYYNTPYSTVHAPSVSFSSKPGDLRSKDDFYQLSSGLIVLETSLPVLNDDPYKKLTPEKTIPTWIRVIVANRMAKDAVEWTTLFKQYNSGTHNNEWFVLDTNKFTKGKPLPPQSVFALDQSPGYVEVMDMTDELNTNGWIASINIPRSKKIWSATGYPEYVKNFGKYGHWFSYEDAPRMAIMRRDAPKVKTWDDLKKFMRANDYKNDELSEGYPFNQIAARWDVIEENPLHFKPQAYGAIDAKLTNLERLRNMNPEIIAGPTTDADYLEPFNWDTASVGQDTSHIGMPSVWKFDWQDVRPE
ncbi:hypothetical protein PCE1_001869 [Barthelona sp. PCE]